MKKYVSLILLLLIALSLNSCAVDSGEGTAEVSEVVEEQDSTTRTVVDAADRVVEIPENIERIVITCRGGSTNEVSIFADAGMIVGQPSQKSYPQLLKMFPYFKEVVDPGSFDDVSVEQVLELNPDIVFVGVSSKKGNALLEEAGLTTYTMQIGSATAETLKKEFINMGKILNNEDKAEKLVAYWEEKIDLVNKLVSQVPESERKRVYYTSKAITDANTGAWGQSWIETAGGVSVFESSFSGDVSVEQVLQWDPDVILTHAGSGISEIMNDERVQDLQAIKNKEVYGTPTGAFWWDRPSPESPLSFLWLAKTLYPDYTAEIDLKAEALFFFKTFYGYDLSDEEYESFYILSENQ